MNYRRLLIAIPLLVLLCQAGCSEQNVAAIPTIELDKSLTQKFQASCANCHSNAATGAPAKGDTETWESILQKPIEETMARVINGHNGMPPLGQCFDCSESDLQTLVYFLAQPNSEME